MHRLKRIVARAAGELYIAKKIGLFSSFNLAGFLRIDGQEKGEMSVENEK